MDGDDPLRGQDLGPYLHVADEELRLLSVFDDLTYDRADADILTPGMRSHLAGKLKGLGFRQKSGNLFVHSGAEERCLVPKSHALGASPFDILRYTERQAKDYVALTPTQVACQLIDAYPLEEAAARVKALVTRHPINLFRLTDYLENKRAHDAFQDAIGHLRFVQREAVEGSALRRMRPLGFSL